MALRESDPGILPRQLQQASAREVAARFGDTFADALSRAPLHVWHGPVRSSYGLHFVLVSAREPARLPSLSEARPKVTADFVHDRREEIMRHDLRALRAHYRIEVQRQRS